MDKSDEKSEEVSIYFQDLKKQSKIINGSRYHTAKGEQEMVGESGKGC